MAEGQGRLDISEKTMPYIDTAKERLIMKRRDCRRFMQQKRPVNLRADEAPRTSRLTTSRCIEFQDGNLELAWRESLPKELAIEWGP
jgi:hypothetical protein